ncbi:MAG: DUF1905 domain-containing protein [Acidobacteria bacterium]|nr:DUF1905 domain-containing protein [Acidobacteriota bacterium]
MTNRKTTRVERFSGIIEIRGINPYINVKAAIMVRLKAGWRKPMPVLVRINGQPTPPWRINLMPRGAGDFYLYLHGNVRKASGTRVGDRVRVELRFDDSYRAGAAGYKMPAWFDAALRSKRQAKAAWNALVSSRKKEVLRYFAGLKSAEARERNLRRVMEVLSGKKARFMARTWTNGK